MKKLFVLLLLLAPVLILQRGFMMRLFSRHSVTLRIVLAAAALGVTMRPVGTQGIAGIGR